jgi:hypothetical protein
MDLKKLLTQRKGCRRMNCGSFQLVKKHACGGFFDDFCTVCLGAYGSPGGKRR